jgi:hypothetical protein
MPSPEQIRALPAGRELDDLVYLHVFGVADPCECGTGTGGPDEVCGVCGKPTRRQWSGDVAAAWDVAGWLRNYFGRFELTAGLEWHCMAGCIEPWGSGETAPLAVCRAALLVAEARRARQEAR